MRIVKISDIEIPNLSDLNAPKLHALEDSFNDFETQLNSRFEPIAPDVRSGMPYKIISGRRRVYHANEIGLKELKVVII
jgi:hypothetical protein